MVEHKVRATLITGRTIDQGVGKELGKGSKEYYDSAAVCFLDKADIIKLGLRGGAKVRVTSQYGSVVVKAKKFPRTMTGMVFMPCGLWANAITGDETYSMGMPLFKGFPVEIEPAPNEPVLTLDELLLKQFGRKGIASE
jgi:formylmethanofuran dehydrogenase subunit D